MDSGSEQKKKDYTNIRSLLDDALEVYAENGGEFKKGAEKFRDGRHMFKHIMKFACVKQSDNSVKEAYYALHHLRAIVRDAHIITLPFSLRAWAEAEERMDDDELKDEFLRIQTQIATIV